MENIIKDIHDIMADVKAVEARTGEYKKDLYRGINSTSDPELDTFPNKGAKIEEMLTYMLEAKDDMDRLQDSLKEVTIKLDNLLDVVEYEDIAKEIRK
jgi:hypothetical protein